MGKVDCLPKREPALFWALRIVNTCQHLTLPASSASLHRCAGSMTIDHICKDMLGSILKDDLGTVCYLCIYEETQTAFLASNKKKYFLLEKIRVGHLGASYF